MLNNSSLAMVEFTMPMVAALLTWILCVCVHEFSHAIVAYWGGDDSVKAKGYLSLNPTRFIDPVFSLLVPAIVLMIGGLPLPGGAVMIDESRLKNRKWGLYVSAAGPISNFILFLLFAFPLHPKFGIVDLTLRVQPLWVYFLGAMATLNFIATLFNLIPCPPLDGYRLIEHKLPANIQAVMRQPQASLAMFAALFLLFTATPKAFYPFIWMLEQVTDRLGLPAWLLLDGFSFVLFNR